MMKNYEMKYPYIRLATKYKAASYCFTGNVISKFPRSKMTLLQMQT